jgi:Phosphotransferase enzyme family
VPGLPRGEVTPLRHNPARRLVAVLESHGERWVLKAHAQRGHGDHARRLAGAVPDWAVAPLAGTSRDGRLVAHQWVPGRPARPGSDDAAVVAVLEALHGSPPVEELPRLDVAALRAAAVAGVAGLAVFDPEVADFARGLLPSLGRVLEVTPSGRGESRPVLLHGDLSPDQVVVDGATAVLLDLDRACVGAAGWDAATWLTGQVAAGGRDDPVPLPVEPPEPGLVAAAALARSAEPWRRRLPDRGVAAAGLVALAARDLGMEP